MPDVVFPISNGIDTASDETQLKQGFSRLIKGGVYRPDDPDCLYPLPPRTAAGLVHATNPVGLDHIVFSGGASYLLSVANGRFYEALAAQAALTWSTAKDAAGADYTTTGTHFEAIYDGTDRWLAFTGGASERPLVRDADGNWYRLGMFAPAAPTLNAINGSSGTVRSPQSSSGAFSNGANAYDKLTNPTGWQDTAASVERSTAGSDTHTWDFTGAGAGNPSAGYTLYVRLQTISLPPVDTGDGGTGSTYTPGQQNQTEPFVATLTVECSEDTGANYTLLFSQSVPVTLSTISFPFATALSFDQIRVRATLTYTSGTRKVTVQVIEIWADTAGTALIPQGNYYYTVTEVHKIQLADGTWVVRESEPSPMLKVPVTGTAYAIKLDLPARQNQATDGCATAKLYRRIYRSTLNSTWPDLGFIAEVAITDTSFNDNFTQDATLLGVPSIFTVSVQGMSFAASGPPPAFRDAVIFRGAVVAIPTSDPRRIQWSLPGIPDCWPLPVHDLALVPSDRNDELMALMVVNDVLLVFMRHRVIRLRELPFANRSDFDLGRVEVDVLSPSYGLTNTMGVCLGSTQKGRAIVLWASDNGIWMTDGSTVAERGMGLVKASAYLDWQQTVPQDYIDTVRLVFEPVQQIVWLDAEDTSGRFSYALHIASNHWVPTGQDQIVPKITGPHGVRLIDRAVGETDGKLLMWGLDASGYVWNEAYGTTDEAHWFDTKGDIETHIETGWNYPAGPLGEVHIYEGTMYHSDWGPYEACSVDVLVRRDDTGVVQGVTKRAVKLSGTRTTRYWVDRAGQAVKLIIRHIGPYNRVANIGPSILSMESTGDLER